MKGAPLVAGQLDLEGHEIVYVGDGFHVSVWNSPIERATAITVSGDHALLSVQRGAFGYYVDEQAIEIRSTRH